MGSIGDFAEQLLSRELSQLPKGTVPEGTVNESVSQRKENPSFFPPALPLPETQRDITNVRVPDDFISSILEGKTYQPEPAVEEKKEEPEDSSANIEELISEFKSLLGRAKKVLTLIEETGVGSIGVNMAGYPKSKKKKKKRKASNEDIFTNLMARIAERKKVKGKGAGR